MKHLVLGSKGQIGQYVVKRLEELGEDVVEFDIAMGNRYDLSSEDSYQHLLDKMYQCDFVHFLAFDVGGSHYLEKYQDSFHFIENNMAIMFYTFSALHITKKPFYFASSQMSNMSHSTYGRLKAVGEAYTKSLPDTGLIVHFWNVFGIETDPEKTHVITDFVRMALRDRRILMRTNGQERRNFIYAPDAAKILCNISSERFDHYRAFHQNGPMPVVADRSFISIREVANSIVDIVGEDVEIFYRDQSDNIQGIINDIPFRDEISLYDLGIPVPYKERFLEGLKEIVEYESILR